MQRPDHLPDYSDPPLDEVVLGIQFSPVSRYGSIHAVKVWKLFSDEYPSVQEHPILDPQFETFGGANVQAGPQFVFGESSVGSRIWFLSEDENHVVQFQPDRFILNWRRRPNVQPYPHFEGLAEAYLSNIRKLEEFFSNEFEYRMDINQAEVSYINIIPVERFSQIGEWFQFWDSDGFELEGLSASFSEVIRNANDKPFARLHHQLQSVLTADGKQKAYRLSLSYKGKPAGNDVTSAMDFLKAGREAIVLRFGQMTTARAQDNWGKIQ